MHAEVVIKPVVTQEQIKGLRWFQSLARTFEGHCHEDEAPMELHHSLQFYGLYAQTGDQRYLAMCEDFLRSALATA
jgi:hypothetical protein